MSVPSTPQDLINLIREKLFNNTSGKIDEPSIREVLEWMVKVLDAKFSFLSPDLTEEQYAQWNLMLDYMVRETKGVLTTSSVAPTEKGKYLLSGAGTYTNLGGLVATADKLNYAYFNGSSWSLISTGIPNASTTFDKTNNISSGTMKAISDNLFLKKLVNELVDLVPLYLDGYLDGKVLATDGNVITNASYMISGFIPIDKTKFYTPTQKYNVIFYDQNKNYLAGIDNSRTNLYFKPQDYNSNAYYVRISGTKTPTLRLVEGQYAVAPSEENFSKPTRYVFNENYPIDFGVKSSELINDKNFVTQQELKEVSNLDNYYKKSEVEVKASEISNSNVYGASNIANQSISLEKLHPSLVSQLGSGSTYNVTNQADESDLTSLGGFLSLKDRSNFVYLKNIALTQAIVSTWANKTVIVRYAHTISENLTFPSSVILVFQGGSFTSATPKTVIFNKCTIVADRVQIFSNTLTDAWEWVYVTGSSHKFKADRLFPEWFGSDDLALKKLSQKGLGIISLEPSKVYYTSATIEGMSIEGNFATIQRATTPIRIAVSNAIDYTQNENSLTLANTTGLKIGQTVVIVNKNGASRKYLTPKNIKSISGNTVNIFGSVGGSSFSANEGDLCNYFPMIILNNNNFIKDCTVDGSLATFSSSTQTFWEFANGIQTPTSAENVLIFNNKIINHLSEGVMFGGKNVKVEGNYIYKCNGNGLHISGAYACVINKNFIFDTNLNLTLEHNEGNITFSNDIYQTRITENYFDGGLCGIGSLDANFNSHVVIANNIFKRYKTHGIDIQGTVKNLNISHNFFYGKKYLETNEQYYLPNLTTDVLEASGHAINAIGGTRNITVIGNSFVNASLNFNNSSNLILNSNSFLEENVAYTLTVQASIIKLTNVSGTFVGNTAFVNASTSRTSIKSFTTVTNLKNANNYLVFNNVEEV